MRRQYQHVAAVRLFDIRTAIEALCILLHPSCDDFCSRSSTLQMRLHQSEHGVARQGFANVREGQPRQRQSTHPKPTSLSRKEFAGTEDARHMRLRENDCVSNRGLQTIESVSQWSRDVQCGCGVLASTVPTGQHLPPEGGDGHSAHPLRRWLQEQLCHGSHRRAKVPKRSQGAKLSCQLAQWQKDVECRLAPCRCTTFVHS